MRFELVILLITGLIIANMYTEGKYVKTLLSFKKYYKMIGVAFVGLALCWLFRKNPNHAHVILNNSNEYIKYLPIDKNVTSMFAPLLNLSKQSQPMDDKMFRGGQPETNSRLFESGRTDPQGKKATKRSVSETKKKFVAARQNWHCGDCKNQLSAWFEVDHTVRLENGGSNHIDNLVALCRECHGKKTAIENL